MLIVLLWFFSQIKKNLKNKRKKINAVLWAFNQIADDLKAGKIIIIEDKTNLDDLFRLGNFIDKQL